MSGARGRRPAAALAGHVVPDLADVDAAANQLVAGGLDVLDDQQQALQRLGHRRPLPSPNWIEAGEPGGVNCTPRVSGVGLKSMSSRQPRRW